MSAIPLGYARIFRDTKTGALKMDKHTLRADSVDGEYGDDFGDDDLGDDDFGDDDDFGAEDDLGDDDLGDDDLGDDDLGDDDLGDDDFGASTSSSTRRRIARRNRKIRKLQSQLRRGKKKVRWQKTAVSGNATFAGAGVAGTITITPASWLKLEDITFTGTTAGTVKAITVGDKLLWSSSTGIPASIFATTGFVRGMLRGTNARPGVPILIDVVSGAAETITSTLFARKPARC